VFGVVSIVRNIVVYHNFSAGPFFAGPFFHPELGSLYTVILYWTPALSFSFGMDAITTSMIAGRLWYIHLRRRKIVAYRSSSYMPILIIFVEPAVLSLVSKGLHLGLWGSLVLSTNPIVIPICVCSQLKARHDPLTID
jgi:hypothetical protein